jgi:hypothetical protein
MLFLSLRWLISAAEIHFRPWASHALSNSNKLNIHTESWLFLNLFWIKISGK